MVRASTVLFVVVAGAVPAVAQCANQWVGLAGAPVLSGNQVCVAWDPDGPGPAGESLVVAGQFATAPGGIAVANITIHDLATGAWSGLGSGVNGIVRTLAVLPNGELVAGGDFTTAGSAPANRIARWNGTTWQPCGGGSSSSVPALAVAPSGALVAIGQFGASTVAQWSGTSWSPLPPLPDPNWVATCVAVMQNGDVVVGARNNQQAFVVRWDGSAWTQMIVFTPASALTPEAIHAMVVMPNGDLMVGGDLGSPNVLRWNGVTWQGLGGLPLGIVLALFPRPNGELLAGFAGSGPGPFQPVWRWNGSFTPFGSGITGYAGTVTGLANGDVVAGGAMSLSGATCLARCSGASWSSMTGPPPVLIGVVNAIAPSPDGTFVVGGSFFPGVSNVSRWTGSAWATLGSPLGNQTTHEVRALARLPNGDVVAGGLFPIPGGFGLARWNGAAWSSINGGAMLPVNALATAPNGDLIVGGTAVLRWNGAAWSGLSLGITSAASDPVRALAMMSNGDVIAGGVFSAISGVPCANIARWNGVAWSPLGAGVDGVVSSLSAAPNGDLLVGGTFTTAGGAPASSIARWNGTAWSPLGAGVWWPPSAEVLAISTLPDGDVLIGGTFTAMYGIPTTTRIARWNGTNWSPVASNVVGDIHALAWLASGEVAAGGDFLGVDGVESHYAAKLATTCPAAAAATGAGCTGSGGPNVLTTTSPPWTGSTFTALATGMPGNAIALAVFGFTPLSIPLVSLLPQGGPGCSLLASPDLVIAALPASGALTTTLVVPDSPALAGLQLQHQVAVLELGVAGAISAFTSTNALQLTIGSF